MIKKLNKKSNIILSFCDSVFLSFLSPRDKNEKKTECLENAFCTFSKQKSWLNVHIISITQYDQMNLGKKLEIMFLSILK